MLLVLGEEDVVEVVVEEVVEVVEEVMDMIAMAVVSKIGSFYLILCSSKNVYVLVAQFRKSYL